MINDQLNNVQGIQPETLETQTGANNAVPVQPNIETAMAPVGAIDRPANTAVSITQPQVVPEVPVENVIPTPAPAAPVQPVVQPAPVAPVETVSAPQPEVAPQTSQSDTLTEPVQAPVVPVTPAPEVKEDTMIHPPVAELDNGIQKFGKIKYITENIAKVEALASAEEMGDVMNINVVFEAPDQYILGEVEQINEGLVDIRFLGEFINGKYVSGVIRKPVMSSKVRMINDQELKAIVGVYDGTTFKLGESSIYKGYEVCVDINSLFANHMAVFGNTGSGKSCGVARIVQNIFSNPQLISKNANIFIFDAYGEYKTAFKDLDKLNDAYHYKFVTTNVQEETDYELHIPFHLLSLDDLVVMLQVDKHSQIPILERALKLTKIFSKDDEQVERYKNHLIAKALIAILYSNQITANKKNDIFKVLEVCHTKDFDFDSVIQGLGYTRTLSECFEIDSNGNFGESVLITDYILKHIDEDLEMTEEPVNPFYSMKDFDLALEFTLISEGFQNNKQLYDDSMLLKVRLNSLLNSKIASIYSCQSYVSTGTYIQSLVGLGKDKAQVININLEDVDDTQAKIIVKIMARIFFEYCKTLKNRATIPFHLFLEEAHRYVSKDADVYLLGYNIFERIAKEGRKYGVLLGIISQRPVEISETVIAQCSNFLIFKMTHPKDIEYISTMLPNISQDVIEKQKILQPGNCVGFGGAFKLPMVVKMEMPNPAPNSNSCNVNTCWKTMASFEGDPAMDKSANVGQTGGMAAPGVMPKVEGGSTPDFMKPMSEVDNTPGVILVPADPAPVNPITEGQPVAPILDSKPAPIADGQNTGETAGGATTIKPSVEIS